MAIAAMQAKTCVGRVVSMVMALAAVLRSTAATSSSEVRMVDIIFESRHCKTVARLRGIKNRKAIDTHQLGPEKGISGRDHWTAAPMASQEERGKND